MAGTVTVGGLEPEGRLLIEMMQSMNFGRIEQLCVRGGKLIMSPPPRVVRDVKIGGENGSRPEANLSDFALKKEVVELLGQIACLNNATIHSIEIKHGLPFKMAVEEDAA